MIEDDIQASNQQLVHSLWPNAVNGFVAVFLLLLSSRLLASDATFIRGINLNGSAVMLDGHAWESSADAKDFKSNGKTFENQKVVLKPATDVARSQMIRSSIWGGKVELELKNLSPGPYQIFLYVWEDNNNEQFDLLVNDQIVESRFHSGSTGMWKRFGPWPAMSVEGKITVSARGASHGAANLSGLELWSGDGKVPEPAVAQFSDVPTSDQIAFFESKIRPVLIDRCYQCHSASAKKIKGDLVLDSRAGVQKGGDSGPAITPGDPEASLIIEAIRHVNEGIAMPPKKKLPPDVIADFEAWVRMGAPDPRDDDTVAALKAKATIDWDKARDWWSFHPLTTPELPLVKTTSWIKNDVDRFVLEKLEAEKLKPANDANKSEFIRRATYDLIGLPPTPEEVDTFVADNSPDAFARVVDRLLDSPRYGERWGRHWLDVVRYADTAGDNSDYPIPQIYRYRDWVIDAFNRDLPYDEFVRHQLAGDLLGGDSDQERYERIIATGYIANSRRFGSRVDDYPQHLTIEDTIDNLGRAFLGLTVNCARCHDHKFDPITSQDYYALYGIFHSTRYPWPGIELDKKQRDFVPLVPPDKLAEADVMRKNREKEQVHLDKEVQRLKDSLKDADVEEKKAIETQRKQAEIEADEHQKKSLPFELAYAVAESTKISSVPVQQKGDPAKPGETVPRRFLTVLGGAEVPAEIKSSGRMQLADWILANDNPLPARVMANRIWLHHFERGIVATPNDFGKQGKPPTHPELLDFLAAKFRDGGWSVKAMHRLIMLSHTYQLATARDEKSIANDPTNELLASFPRLRLEAESIRDTLLALGGNLDLSPALEHPFPPQHEWKFTQHNAFKAVYESDHRSVYLMTQRIQRHPFLAIFDGADPSASTPVRPTSTTPLQALFLLNDPFVHKQSNLVAERITSHASDNTTRIQFAYQLLFARPAIADEVDASVHFLNQARQQLKENGLDSEKIEPESWRSHVCALFRLNEFVYLD